MTSLGFGILPPGVIGTPEPFTLSVPKADLHQLNCLARNAVIAPPSYYTAHNHTTDPSLSLSLTRDWISDAVSDWTNPSVFDWRAKESQANFFPQFTVNVTAPSDNQVFQLHFAALFSRKPDATPIVFLHGWPSSWLDYLGILEILTQKYTPETLPYHIITPSIPDFGLSTRSNLTETELDFWKAAEALNELMKTLGFGRSGYIAQGGDVGSGLTAVLGSTYDECKAVHFNNILVPATQIAKVVELNLPITPEENVSISDGNTFAYAGTGYMIQQGTKPGSISLVLMSNPVALFTWIAQEFVEARSGSFDDIMTQVSWYWLTKSYSRTLWPYRALWEPLLKGVKVEQVPSALVITGKPLGYSWFPKEVISTARSWVEHWFPDNLVFYRAHSSGGHFAALDEPEAFLQDIEDFIEIVKGKVEF